MRSQAVRAFILETPPPAELMPHFDALPANVRRAVADATFPYEPREIAARLSRGVRPATIVRQILRLDERRMAR